MGLRLIYSYPNPPRYGDGGSPGMGPAQWAYKGSSMGYPEEPVGDRFGDCNYALSPDLDDERGWECRLAPSKGGYENTPNPKT